MYRLCAIPGWLSYQSKKRVITSWASSQLTPPPTPTFITESATLTLEHFCPAIDDPGNTNNPTEKATRVTARAVKHARRDPNRAVILVIVAPMTP